MIFSKIKGALPFIVVQMLFIAFTPYIFHMARLQRGYDALGGELFFPLIPLIFWAFVDTLKQTVIQIKKHRKRGKRK